MKVKQTERAMEDVAKRENPKYAVVNWDEYERRIVEAYGHASIQHVITVLYRYNTVRNDFVDLKIMIKKYRDGDCDGFYFTNTTKNVRILVHRKKTGDTYGVIDLTTATADVIKTYVKENKLHGRRLLKESINAIVRYDEDSENKHTAQHTAD
jgi:hypothetical protein